MTFILPYMEEAPLFATMNLNGRDYDYCNGPASPGATVIGNYICPDDEQSNKVMIYNNQYYFGMNSYFGNAGTKAWPLSNAKFDGVIYFNSRLKVAQITDGTSHTFLVGERNSADPTWTNSTPLSEFRGWAWNNYNSGQDSLGDTNSPMNSTSAAIGESNRKTNFGSGHSGGANFGYADGSCDFVTLGNSADFTIYQRLSMREDGDVISQ